MKFTHDRAMKSAIVISIVASSKCATLALYVLKPPVAIVPNEWQSASKRLMPSIKSSTVRTAFSPT